MSLGKLRLFGALTAIPLVGVGVLMTDMEKLSMQIELALSGASSSHSRNTSRESVANGPNVLVPFEARRLFSANGKGPRADLYLEVNRTAYAPRDKRRVVAALTPVDLELTGSVKAGAKEDHVVNRTNKGGRIKAPVTTIVKAEPTAIEPVAVVEDSKPTAALLLASVQDSFDHKFVGKIAGKPRDRVAVPTRALISRGIAFKGETETDYITRQRRCLATAIYFEARGEPREGKLAVAQVVMNRVRSPAYADTVCGVVYQGQWQRKGCQFSFACDGKADVARNPVQWRISNTLAKKVLRGEAWLKDIDNATHYHATYVKPAWRRSMKHIRTIGKHIFYRAPTVPIRDKDQEIEAAAIEGNQAQRLALAANE